MGIHAGENLPNQSSTKESNELIIQQKSQMTVKVFFQVDQQLSSLEPLLECPAFLPTRPCTFI